MSAVRIHGQHVIAVEGDAAEFIPDVRGAKGMHGFAIMVPKGEGGERLLDMLWRIAIAYQGRRSLLASKVTVRKMVEAVMSREARSEDESTRKRSTASRKAKASVSRTNSGPDRKSETAGVAARLRKGSQASHR